MRLTAARARGSQLHLSHRVEILGSHRDAILLDDRPAVEVPELREHRGEIDRALAERAEEVLLPRLLDGQLPRAHALEDARFDVLQVEVRDPVARQPCQLDGIAAADDRVPGVEAILTTSESVASSSAATSSGLSM